jgi:hypothetical protein
MNDQQITFGVVDSKKAGFAGQMVVKAANGFNGFWNAVTTKGPLGVVDNLANWIAGDLLDIDPATFEAVCQELDKLFSTVTQAVVGAPKALLMLGLCATVCGPGNMTVAYGDAGFAGGSSGGASAAQVSEFVRGSDFDDGTSPVYGNAENYENSFVEVNQRMTR